MPNTKTLYLRLDRTERKVIEQGIANNHSCRFIATLLRRSHSTISMEIQRNGGRGNYQSNNAQKKATKQSQRPQKCKLEKYPQLEKDVNDKLLENLSPEQISYQLRVEYPDQPDRNISSETLYSSIYAQKAGKRSTHLTLSLRNGRFKRMPRTRMSHQGKIQNMTLIDERPTHIESREESGHLEGDLIIGKGGQSQIVTLVDRTTRKLTIIAVPGQRTSENVVHAIHQYIKDMPPSQRKTLTWDQGKEMAQHERLTQLIGILVYFCHPHTPWARGTNENTNRLIRQFIPKGTDINQSQEELNRIADSINNRPRKTLGWKSSNELCALFREDQMVG